MTRKCLRNEGGLKGRTC
ncbi:hypothetical protein Bra1253DRAFT_08342 [Bradyrhizobium sp. WSM1253]|nr:hypothetical protein Bra1253DRAFT_08342 [Bradyrhizobium sp. WSM1253]